MCQATACEPPRICAVDAFDAIGEATAPADPQPFPEDSAIFRLLTAAHKLASASAEVVACAHNPRTFAQDLAANAASPATTPSPLDEALDLIADAIVELHRAGGDHPDTERLAEAAAARILGMDR
jgi:hypothetical protein